MNCVRPSEERGARFFLRAHIVVYVNLICTQFLTIAKQLGSRWCAGKTARWVPIVGQGAAAALSYGLVKWLGEQHVRECLAVRSRVAALLPYEKDSLKKNAQQS